MLQNERLSMEDSENIGSVKSELGLLYNKIITKNETKQLLACVFHLQSAVYICISS